jgi:hypothetical protein
MQTIEGFGQAHLDFFNGCRLDSGAVSKGAGC